jgi:hypothetical protein
MIQRQKPENPAVGSKTFGFSGFLVHSGLTIYYIA